MPINPTPPTRPAQGPAWQTLAELVLPSQLDSDRQARAQVAEVVRLLNLPETHLERLKTAVAEATLNAIEHGNRYRPDAPVIIRVQVSEHALRVSITDQGREPISPPEPPDLAAKVSGQQTLRGWGFFLIERMVDELQVREDGAQHTIELFLYLESP
jgi:anti-sigma regulatory factor (Ser/Thr protein kinase)